LSVTRRAAKELDGANAVIAYTGFAIEAFDHVQNLSRGITALNYPIAHHAHHRQMRAEELEREPEFMETWPSLDHWSRAYEEQVDAEIERADVILVGSSYARDTFTAAGIAADRIRVVPYGVDLETFGRSSGTPEAPRSDSTFRVIYAGQISQRKGLSYLMKGYGAFRKPDSQLTLVGTPPGPTNALARYSHLFTHVPHLTRPELAARYRESDVFVFPTLVEGMPLVVLEAMAAGLPVIVTPHGPNDLVRDGVDGFVVPIRDPEAIHDRLERLYREPDLRRAMGESARQRAQEYSWDVYARRVEQLLQDMLSSRILGH
jgi:glycosyltransferase involved in cell wall biosynthesis